ncbi:Jerky -like protein-like [Trichinella pseudospiralis]|uniref:Jerky-like protein-like n=1 Tax=Trichinella pseudospiralis TaxID=6337 RepID=A0A0V1G5W3_TRIPS|nr:Jerky -like protein-like [Trichinella pseudospiralis]
MNVKFNLRFINTFTFCGFRIFMPRMSTTRNGKVLSLEEKLEVIKRMDSGDSFRKIAGNFGVGLSTISDICCSRRQLSNFVSHMDTSNTVAYLMSRVPNEKETFTTPYEEWFGKL